MNGTEQEIAIAKYLYADKPKLRVFLRSKRPAYTCDLNAMHEAEKALDMHQQYEYGEALARMTIGEQFDDPEGFSPNGWGYYAPITATASQRAEAFLKTLNLWTGKQL